MSHGRACEGPVPVKDEDRRVQVLLFVTFEPTRGHFQPANPPGRGWAHSLRSEQNIMWNRDEVKGKVDQAKGRAEETAGKATGNDDLRGRGEADEIKGKAEDTFGNARRKVGNALDDLGKKISR